MKVAPIKLMLILLVLTVCWALATNALAGDSAKAPQQADAKNEPPSPVVNAGVVAEAAVGKSTDAVTGAFGLQLGKRFEPCMVAKVISREEHNYRGRDKAKFIGILYRVEPKVPNRYFNQYAVKTTKGGVIHTIQGGYEPQEKINLCKQTSHLAGLLESKYGKPRGKGMMGDWYTFRESVSGPYRGVRFYAPKCRNGRYSISYSDDNAKQAELTPLPEPTEMSGL